MQTYNFSNVNFCSNSPSHHALWLYSLIKVSTATFVSERDWYCDRKPLTHPIVCITINLCETVVSCIMSPEDDRMSAINSELQNINKSKSLQL